jgi:hypothetical protein
MLTEIARNRRVPAATSRAGLGTAALSVLVLAAIAIADSYPKPAASPSRWELRFQPGELRLHTDPVENKTYWFFDYMIINRTGRDQVWAPSFVLFTDGGEIMRSGEGVPLRVTREIMDLIGNDFLQHQYEIIGEIHHGIEHAREGIVVWPARKLNVTEISLFIGGISGETAHVQNPLNGETVLLRKTLQRDYLIPGDPAARGRRPARFVEERWIFR